MLTKVLVHLTILSAALVYPVLASYTDLYGDPCLATAAQQLFGCKRGSGLNECLCDNEEYLATAIACVVDNAPTSSLRQAGLQRLEVQCPQFSEIIAQHISGEAFLLDNYLDAKALNISGMSLDHNVEVRAVRVRNVQKSILHGSAILFYFLLLAVGSAVTNLAFKLWPNLQLKLNCKALRLFKQKVLLPPIVSPKYERFGKTSLTLPTRAQFFILCGLTATNMVFLWTAYEIIMPNYSLPTPTQQYTKYLGTRSGIVMMAELNLLLLFGRRNNVLSWFTGWNIGTFTVYHKWIGRLILVNAVVHCVSETANLIQRKRYMHSVHKPYFAWGAICLTVMCLMVGHSLILLRRRYYEAFLLGHMLLAAVLIAGIWQHIERPKIGYEYLYSMIAIWTFDKMARGIRILYGGGALQASVSLEEGRVLKIRIRCPKRWKPYPGCYAFIYILQPANFWQSHPFTVTSVAHEDGHTILEIYAKVRNGITGSIYRQLANSTERSLQMSVLLEGPYGSMTRLAHYNTVVYIAGGMGIAPLYGYATSKHRSIGQNIVVLWAVRDESPLEWFKEHIKTLSNDRAIDLQIYVTRLASNSDSSVSSDHSSSASLPEVKRYSKLNVAETVRPYFSGAGSLAFVACGPATLCRAVRQVVTDGVVGRDDPTDYIEETFSW